MYDESSFFSINRLIEFGMGMGVAQQMVNTMNSTMQNMQIPGAGNRMYQPVLIYYAVLEGKQAGPFNETEIARLINEGRISKETYIWHTGLREWKTAENLPAVLRLVALSPPPPPEGI